jgi:hypothetical protein
MLLEVEFRYHRDNHRLLLATLSQLEKWREESVDSQKRLEDLSSCSKVESIDEMDEDLMKLLGNPFYNAVSCITEIVFVFLVHWSCYSSDLYNYLTF